ncbi:ABC transporter permease [Geminicoccaceae bacterium 1502E]|nr:ABC transporter permease [Geminicoccaceae bacterium 1502E]
MASTIHDKGAGRPIGLRLLDLLEAARERLWPARMAALTPWLFLLPAVLLTGLLAAGLIPLLDASLRPLDRATFRLAEDYALGNYATLATRPVYGVIALRTLMAGLVVTAATLALAFPYAWMMVRTPHAWLRKLLLVSLFLPFFIGQVVRAYGWLIILGKQGLLNALLDGLGLPPSSLAFTYTAVLIGLVQYMLPFAVLMLAPALTAVPVEVELASASLGARPFATFRHILLPMARPGIVAAGIVVFTLTLTDFAMPEIMGGGGNDFIASAVYDAFFQLGDAGLGAALGIGLTLVGSAVVGVILAFFGLGTLGYVEGREQRS